MAPSNLTVSTQAAANALHISHQALIQLLDRGEIPYVKPGDQRRLSVEDLLAYQQRMRRNHRAFAELG